ncbi:YolD-like family protein [Peribacillus simplex]|uniref:YolD-like family protein n=2 Tax=Peribacillus TaxID=2675229 RepID=A0AA90SK11_9BACI|nr:MULTISPECIES: YolD-like family protein [Peribacillus]MDP1421657.1 YolD-like family protein [Peribacillus simplex]MDP1450926.1 YolD-like family protein [Peribacillus frigoritolerans]
MIRDRGRIKWTSMMLPEHVKMLRDWVGEDGYETKRILDEQQLEEMNAVMGEAMEERKDVTIAHYEGNRYQLLIGRIHYYNELTQKLHIVDRFQQAHYIRLSDIADVRIME